MIALLIVACVIWYISGVASFIYFWTTDHDFTSNEVGLALCIGILGPIAIMVGREIHGKGTNVIISKRDRNDV